LITIGFGALSLYAGYKLDPPREKERYLRPIRIRVDEAICVANSVCIRVAPAVFQLREQKEASLFAPLAYVVDPHGADNDTIILAAQMCPTGAIIIEDAETGERIHPPEKS
jgi:ferredoxin